MWAVRRHVLLRQPVTPLWALPRSLHTTAYRLGADSGKSDQKADEKAETKPTGVVGLSKYEQAGYKIAKWQQKFTELFVTLFRLDPDRLRAGPIAGSTYYSMCRAQGLVLPDEPLSETAKFYYETLGLPMTFEQWYQICLLHEWMLFVRMRALPAKYSKHYRQKLVDRTFVDIDYRLKKEFKIHSNRITEAYAKDFSDQMRGACMAYDEGFYTTDTALATALWRNLFNGEPHVNFQHLEMMVKYVRTQLYGLSLLSDRDFALGKFQFLPPWQSVEPLTPAEEAELREAARTKYKPNSELPFNERSSLSADIDA